MARPPWIVQLMEEWESATCASCGAEKWKRHPFCRSCSIRLQRVGLMKKLKPYAGRNFEALMRFAKIGEKFARFYDLCRDFLIVSKRLGAVQHGD